LLILPLANLCSVKNRVAKDCYKAVWTGFFTKSQLAISTITKAECHICIKEI